ncbi:MAG: hypothetical protein ACE5HX_07950, partial [bacterium]
GSHKDWQIQLTGDYQKVRDEVNQGSIGVEIARSYRYAGRIGYNFNSNQLSKLTFGFSLDLDGILPFKKKVIAGRNNAVRADFAYLEDNDFFAPPLRFGVNRYPILPEKFNLLNPILAVKQADEPVSLSWQATHDPDLYDSVTYALYWAKEDSAGIAELKKARDKMHLDALVSKNPLITSIDLIRPENSNSETLNITLTPPEKCDEITFWDGGNYYWMTVAYDEDSHIRFANQVGKFHVELPDIEITNIDFTPDSWITESDTQGVIKVFVKNNSKKPVKNIVVTTVDSKPVEFTGKGLDVTKADTIWQHPLSNMPSEAQPAIQVDWGTAVLGWKDSIEKLEPGQVDSIEFDWCISDHGKHQFIANAQILCKPNQQLPESDLANNNMTASFYTIPKGTIKTEKEIIVLEETVYEFELPFIRKIFFEHGSAVVPSMRKSHNNSSLDTQVKKFENQFTFSPLDTLAKRLTNHPDIYLRLKGSVDLADGESSSLAQERAEAVKKYLQSHGIDGNRVRIDHIDVIFDKKPIPTIDLTKVHEERRFVKVFAYNASQNNQETSALFHSIRLTMPKSTSFSRVPFISTIHGAVPPDTARVYLKPENAFPTHTALDSSLLVKYPTMSADTTIFWEHYKNKKVKWLDKVVEYSLVLRDTLGREFYTHKNAVVLLSQIRNPIVIVGVADFREEKIDSTGTPWSDIRGQLQKRVRPWSDIMGKLLAQESQPLETTTTQMKESNRPQERIITKISANAKKTIIKRLKENKIGTIRIVGHACNIGGAAINKTLSKKRAENFKNDFLTGLKEDSELAHLIENIKIETEGKGESESFCVDVDSASFMQALKIPQEFELIQKQVNDRLRRDKTFPFTFELFHDRKTHKAKIKIKSDNETPIGRQINRRIEIHFEPIKHPQVFTEKKRSTASKAL